MVRHSEAAPPRQGEAGSFLAAEMVQSLAATNKIKHDVEKSDNSLRDEVHRDDKEAGLRRWLKRKLDERSRHRYTTPQEAEIDQQEQDNCALKIRKRIQFRLK